MKIHVMSDLHLEFGALDKPMPNGEILVLAGDITLLAAFDRGHELHWRHEKLRETTDAFMKEARANFRRIFVVLGNHESYHFSISKAAQTARRVFAGATVLDDGIVDLSDDVILVGGTLWTDMNGGLAHDYIQGSGNVYGARVNDFNLIQIGPRGRLFTTRDAVKKHRRTRNLIAVTAEANPEKIIVVATHHAPSFRGCNRHHARGECDGAYASNLEEMIVGQPNIRYWIHGHTHIQARYKIGQCTVLSNARGYCGREHSDATFDPNVSLEVSSDVLV